MGVAVLEAKAPQPISARRGISSPSPPWLRKDLPRPRQTPSQVQAQRQSIRQAAQLQAAQAELETRLRQLSTSAGRAAFASTLQRWTNFADQKMFEGLSALAQIDGDIRAGRAPPMRQCVNSITVEGEERGRAEARVAEASIARRVFAQAIQLLRSGGWAGHETSIVLDTDEARCRLIENCVEIDMCKGDPRLQFI
ncbi:uncharacterized protein CcaverHIS019_0506890 [Cutaneotrichosporon cavernicola]|uniref:Uncharacterized protein n=1 Tax=Cutaneotrichosporon cavernicola TaxID=279322 RepID=A0AA48QX61_9TREE|nr:uncharacterized protein CcaverHIS019_0506890 [Cutaneotrichosporon cavernicola]BEI93061.1 hypothetical protein CcaverHIS019_0506890 [Cutaneotrichosporon cavernicola]BEJ00838.1 hypothetical protein CcaverHIS631_0506950 [Cutaneotrichosporon cavernicola]BEJ08605.1 hypothetical protein CcaverHIS641_0506990 [Cutaneotrichosporon cavernicola]